MYRKKLQPAFRLECVVPCHHNVFSMTSKRTTQPGYPSLFSLDTQRDSNLHSKIWPANYIISFIITGKHKVKCVILRACHPSHLQVNARLRLVVYCFINNAINYLCPSSIWLLPLFSGVTSKITTSVLPRLWYKFIECMLKGPLVDICGSTGSWNHRALLLLTKTNYCS